MVEAIEAGFPQREIWDAAYQFQRSVDSGEKIVVGVNEFVTERAADRDALHRRGRRGSRSGAGSCGARATGRRYPALAPAPGLRRREDVMPPLIEAVKAYATVGEISDVMREVFGTYEEPAVF